MPAILADKSLLLNAWKRILTSRHIPYRQYQRREMEAFATSSGALLSEIHSRLRDETYMPEAADRVNVPKDNLSDRTLTLLSLPDWVVYTAIVTLISEATFPQERWRYNNSVYSNLPRMGKRRPQGFYQPWERQYHRFNKACEAAAASHPFILDFDLASFYDLVDHDLLLAMARKYVPDAYLLDLLGQMLRSWTGDDSYRAFAHGLPQGPEASNFLADVFLFTVDDQIANSPGCIYRRYVDDIRVFCRGRRECEVLALRLAEAVKRVGLVPNSTKTKVFDTRRTPGWLRQPDYGQFQDPTRRRSANRRGLAARVQHVEARQTFLTHARKKPATPRDELAVRRTLSLMLPDQSVIDRIVQIYTYRPELWQLLFPYLLDCSSNPRVSQFAWRRLSLPPARDWECANLIELTSRTRGNKRLTNRQIATLNSYVQRPDLPLAQAQAAAALLTSRSRKPTAKWLTRLSMKGPHLTTWLTAMLRRNILRRSARRSVLATLRHVLSQCDAKGAMVVAYLAGAKLSKADITTLPAPNSVHAQIVLSSIAQLGRPTGSDDIASLLRVLFNVPARGFDFRSAFASVDRRWYAQALRHLQLAAWYVDTSPTYFANHIHNFNHVLWHFALRKHGVIPATMPWKYSMGQLTNPAAKARFPTMTAVFDKCRVLRNTNLSSHPMDDKRSRFTKLVTYGQRNYIRSQLRAAYREFMTKV